MLPLNFAPSSRLSLGHSMLPRTLPVDVMMTFSKPTIFPLTEPSMETILPVISAFKIPVSEIWIWWLFACTIPVTFPAITISSLLITSPFIFTSAPITADLDSLLEDICGLTLLESEFLMRSLYLLSIIHTLSCLLTCSFYEGDLLYNHSLRFDSIFL